MSEHAPVSQTEEPTEEVSESLVSRWKARFTVWRESLTPEQCVIIKRWSRGMLLLAIGIALGVVAKTESLTRWTMGFQDYTVRHDAARYDFDELERQVAARGASADPTAGIQAGGACGQ
jgi:hypothetical protein